MTHVVSSRFASVARIGGAAVASILAVALMVTAPAVEAQAPKAAPKAPAKAVEHEVTVSITRVRALDQIDGGLAGQADFYARVTIAGETFTTPRLRGANDIRPDWKFTKKVPPGSHDIKIQVLDRDPLKPDDVIDINRVDNKRDLDFKINTKSCRVEGISGTPKCGATIVRAGAERKKAEMTFAVDVKK
jgi:hypothetical protein